MGIRILIVEDDAIIALHLSSALESLGHQPIGNALSSKEALQMAAQERPDLALVDIGLRGQDDGISVAAAFRRDLDIPVIFLTAYTNPETVERARQTEPFGYISKPFDMRSLNATIEIALHRHRMERDLKASEERYRFLFNHMVQGAVYLDTEARIFSANPAAEGILGLNREQLIGLSLFDPYWNCIHENGSRYLPEDFPMIKALASGKPVSGIIMGVYNPRRGEYVWIRVSAVPIFKPGKDKPYQVFSTFDDITDVKRAETAREETATSYLNLIKHLPDIICRFDRDLRYVFISPGAKISDGFDPASFLNKTNREAGFPEEISAQWDEKIRLTFTTGQEQSTNYAMLIDGGERCFEARMFPEFGQDNQVQFVLVINRDTTELLKTQSALQDAEHLLHRLFDNLVGIAYRCKNDPKWTMEFISRGCKDLTGYPPESFEKNREMAFSQIIHADDQQAVWEIIQAALSEKKQYQVTYRIVTRSGEVKWVEGNGQGVYNSAGELEALEGFILDISARKRGEDALIENEAALRQILDSLPAAVLVSDGQGRTEYLSTNFIRLFGYSLQEIPTLDTWMHVAYPDADYRAQVVKTWNESKEQARRNSGETRPLELNVVSKDGAEHIVEIRSTILQEYMVTIFTDMTNIRTAEEDLQRGEAFVRQLLEEAPVAACVASLDRQIEFINRQFSLLLGYNQSEMETLDSWAARVFPDPQERATAAEELGAAMEAALHENGILPVLELRLRAKNGGSKNVRTRGSIISGKLFLTFEDITYYREIEEILTANLAEKDILLREVYHRVKNNLQVVVSLLGLQAARIKDPASRELFIQSQNRIRSMALVHETLYRSAGFTRINFGSYLKDLIFDIRNSFTVQNGINVRLDAQPIFLPIDKAVPCGLIVNELVANAYKYAFPNNRSGTIQVTLSRKAGKVILVVSDDGVGLPGDGELTNSETLGMNLVRILSMQINASIQITREQGTLFCLSFAVAED